MYGLELSIDSFSKTMGVIENFEKWISEQSEESGINKEQIEKMVKNYLAI